MVGLITRGKFGSCCGQGQAPQPPSGGGGGGGAHMPPMSIKLSSHDGKCKELEVRIKRIEEEDVRRGVLVDSVDEE